MLIVKKTEQGRQHCTHPHAPFQGRQSGCLLAYPATAAAARRGRRRCPAPAGAAATAAAGAGAAVPQAQTGWRQMPRRPPAAGAREHNSEHVMTESKPVVPSSDEDLPHTQQRTRLPTSVSCLISSCSHSASAAAKSSTRGGGRHRAKAGAGEKCRHSTVGPAAR